MDRRLNLIKEMVTPCGTVADIGTDHGFLVCALASAGIAQRGIAADIKPMPLDTARREIATQGLSDRIDTILTDGLSGVTLQSGDAVVIAGMGGDLISRILDAGKQHKAVKLSYYLQPMTKPERLREYLYKAGYTIVAERCCIAANRPYSVIQAEYNGAAQAPTPVQVYLGKIDMQAGEGETAYCKKLYNQLSKRVKGIAATQGDSDEVKMLTQVIDKLTGGQ